jgi:hypothetical protein
VAAAQFTIMPRARHGVNVIGRADEAYLTERRADLIHAQDPHRVAGNRCVNKKAARRIGRRMTEWRVFSA